MSDRIQYAFEIDIDDYRKAYEAGRQVRIENPTPTDVESYRRAQVIEGVVFGFFQTDRQAVMVKSRKRHIVFPRQTLMYMLSKYTRYSPRKIGVLYGDFDRTTVLNGIKTVTDLSETDPIIQKQVHAMEKAIVDQILGDEPAE